MASSRCGRRRALKRRNLAMAALAAAIAISGCGSDLRSPPAGPPGSPDRSIPSVSSGFSSPSAGTSSPPGSPATAYSIVELPVDKVRTVRLPDGPYGPIQAHRMAGSGPLLVFDEIGYGDDTHTLGRRIWLADLETETLRTIALAAAGDAAWTPAISGDNVVWVEWRYADQTNLKGSLTWRIMTLDLRDGKPRPLVSGVSRRLEGGQGVPPPVQIDGDRLAYAVEDPTPERPLGWKIVLRSLRSGRIEREVRTALSIYSLGLSGTTIAYSEGFVDQALNFKYRTDLMVSAADHPAPIELAKDAFEVAVDGHRIAWVSDPQPSQEQSGLAMHPRILTATLEDLAPVAISHEPDSNPTRGAYWPAAGDGLISWADDQVGATGPNRGRLLVVWSEKSGAAVQLEPAHTNISALTEGWLLWYDDTDADHGIVVHGIRLTDVPLP